MMGSADGTGTEPPASRPANANRKGGIVRFFSSQRQHDDERLLWSRDIRYANRVAESIPDAHVLELESGTAVIAPASALTQSPAPEIAPGAPNPAHRPRSIHPALPPQDPHPLPP